MSWSAISYMLDILRRRISYFEDVNDVQKEMHQRLQTFTQYKIKIAAAHRELAAVACMAYLFSSILEFQASTSP